MIRRTLRLEALEDRHCLTAVAELLVDLAEHRLEERPLGYLDEVTGPNNSVFVFHYDAGWKEVWELDDSLNLNHAHTDDDRLDAIRSGEALFISNNAQLFSRVDEGTRVIDQGLIFEYQPFGDGVVYSQFENAGEPWGTGIQGELWWSDNVGLDKRRLFAGPRPYALTVAGNELFFATVTHGGNTLWSTDGTAAGTRPILDGVLLQYPLRATAGGGLFFVQPSAEASHGDLTFLDIESGVVSFITSLPLGRVRNMTTSENHLYYSLTTGTANELWHVDTTSLESTRLFEEFPSSYFRVFDGSIYYPVGQASFQIRSPDGDITTHTLPNDDADYSEFYFGKSRIIGYTENFDSDSIELWSFDAPDFNPQKIQAPQFPQFVSISDPNADSYPYPAGRYDEPVGPEGQLFFKANDGIHGQELWLTDGTPEGTRLLRDIHVGSGRGLDVPGTGDDSFIRLHDDWYFPGRNENGWAIWRTDGTEEGTTLVRDFSGEFQTPGFHADVSNFRLVDDRIIFRLIGDYTLGDGFGVRGVGSTDGTAEGTSWVVQGETPLLELSAFYSGIPLGSQVLFESVSGVWTTDKFLQGTTLIKSRATQLIEHQGSGFFVAEETVWKSNGTPAGTHQLSDEITGIRGIINYGELLGFCDATWCGDDGPDWISDGSIDGTYTLADLNPAFATGATIQRLGYGSDEHRLGRRDLIFITSGEGLWLSNGTPHGTHYVGEFGRKFRSAIRSMGDEVAFVSGNELWMTKTDGSGARIVTRFDSLSSGTTFNSLGTIEDQLFFEMADHTSGSSRIFVTDGTEHGTRDLGVDSKSNVHYLGTTQVGIVVTLDDGIHGREPWVLKLLDDLPGDADHDGVVDFADFLVVANNFGKQVDAAWEDGDFNADGHVDFADFLLLANNFGGSQP